MSLARSSSSTSAGSGASPRDRPPLKPQKKAYYGESFTFWKKQEEAAVERKNKSSKPPKISRSASTTTKESLKLALPLEPQSAPEILVTPDASPRLQSPKSEDNRSFLRAQSMPASRQIRSRSMHSDGDIPAKRYSLSMPSPRKEGIEVMVQYIIQSGESPQSILHHLTEPRQDLSLSSSGLRAKKSRSTSSLSDVDRLRGTIHHKLVLSEDQKEYLIQLLELGNQELQLLFIKTFLSTLPTEPQACIRALITLTSYLVHESDQPAAEILQVFFDFFGDVLFCNLDKHKSPYLSLTIQFFALTSQYEALILGEDPDVRFSPRSVEDKSVVLYSATRETLLRVLLDSNYIFHDRKFARIFLSTHKYFISNEDLAISFIDFFNNLDSNLAMEAQLRLKILRTMHQWLEVSENSVRKDESAIKIIRDFIAITETRIQAEKTLLKELETILERPINVHSKRRATFSMSQERIDLSPFSPREFAEQLTVLAVSMVRHVRTEELLNANKKALSPNFECLVTKFNNITTWIAKEILIKFGTTDRVNMLSYFIQAAEVCRNNRDFSSAYSIYCALNMFCISRLTQTWEKLPKKDMSRFKKLDALFNMDFNFAEYRKTLLSMRATAIPVMAILTKDVIRYETDPTLDALGHVDVDKLRKIYELLESFEQCKEYSVNDLKKNDELFTFLNELIMFNTNEELDTMSFALQAPQVSAKK